MKYTNTKQTERNKKIRRMRKNRYTYREIGEKYNLTLQRIRAICNSK